MSDALGRSIAEELAEPLRGRVRILRPNGVLFVDGKVVRLERPLGEDEPGNGLAREVHEPAHAGCDRRFEHVERAHDVVPEHDVWWVVNRLRDRRRVHDGITVACERIGRTCIREVGLPVVLGLARIGPVPGRESEIGRSHVVARRSEARTERPANLPSGARDENLHVRDR